VHGAVGQGHPKVRHWPATPSGSSRRTGAVVPASYDSSERARRHAWSRCEVACVGCGLCGGRVCRRWCRTVSLGYWLFGVGHRREPSAKIASRGSRPPSENIIMRDRLARLDRLRRVVRPARCLDVHGAKRPLPRPCPRLLGGDGDHGGASLCNVVGVEVGDTGSYSV
jgi:hypothetical protein